MRIKNNAKFCIPQQRPHIKMWSNLKKEKQREKNRYRKCGKNWSLKNRKYNKKSKVKDTQFGGEFFGIYSLRIIKKINKFKHHQNPS